MTPRSSTLRRAAAALGVAAVLAVGPRASAQTSGEKAAAAQALFDEAMRLVKAGQFSEACPKLEESLHLDPGMGTQFRLAECYEKVGKVASAWASFVAVADAAAVARLPEREAAARKRAEALVPRIARLTLTVSPAVAALEGVEIQRDGTPVGKALWSVPVPVDPGEHVVIVRAPGKKPWEGRVTASDAGGAVSLLVPLLEDLPRGTATPPPPPPPGPERPRRSVAPAVALGGVAVAALAAGAGLFAVHASRKSDAEALSAQIKGTPGTCVPGAAADARCGALADKASSADTFGNLSTVGFAVGGAAAVGMITYLLWPQPAAVTTGTTRSVRFAPVVGRGTGGISVTGAF